MMTVTKSALGFTRRGFKRLLTFLAEGRESYLCPRGSEVQALILPPQGIGRYDAKTNRRERNATLNKRLSWLRKQQLYGGFLFLHMGRAN